MFHCDRSSKQNLINHLSHNNNNNQKLLLHSSNYQLNLTLNSNFIGNFCVTLYFVGGSHLNFRIVHCVIAAARHRCAAQWTETYKSVQKLSKFTFLIITNVLNAYSNRFFKEDYIWGYLKFLNKFDFLAHSAPRNLLQN